MKKGFCILLAALLLSLAVTAWGLEETAPALGSMDFAQWEAALTKALEDVGYEGDAPEIALNDEGIQEITFADSSQIRVRCEEGDGLVAHVSVQVALTDSDDGLAVDPAAQQVILATLWACKPGMKKVEAESLYRKLDTETVIGRKVQLFIGEEGMTLVITPDFGTDPATLTVGINANEGGSDGARIRKS